MSVALAKTSKRLLTLTVCGFTTVGVVGVVGEVGDEGVQFMPQ